MKPLSLSFQSPPELSDVAVVLRGLDGTVPSDVPPIEKFAFFLKDDRSRIVAGATGCFFFGAIYTELLWVAPELRGQGQAKRLMDEVENLGRDRGCTFATVNTMSFQARPFYEKLGYIVEYEQKGYAGGASKFFLRKSLSK